MVLSARRLSLSVAPWGNVPFLPCATSATSCQLCSSPWLHQSIVIQFSGFMAWCDTRTHTGVILGQAPEQRCPVHGPKNDPEHQRWGNALVLNKLGTGHIRNRKHSLAFCRRAAAWLAQLSSSCTKVRVTWLPVLWWGLPLAEVTFLGEFSSLSV